MSPRGTPSNLFRESIREFRIYNQGSWARYPRMDRDRFGVYVWKIGAKGCFKWVYTWEWKPTVPPNWHPSFMYTVPAPDGPLPTTGWEAVREGIDDIRYIQTLSKLIEKAKKSGKPEAVRAAADAEKELNGILDNVKVRWEEREAYIHGTPSATYNANRRKVADSIIKLQGLLLGRHSR